MHLLKFICLSSLCVCTLCACRHDEYVTYMITEDTGSSPSAASATGVTGLYVLNEGNMGANKCTLDYLDLSSTDGSVPYYRNIYAQRNPDVVLELGDVGNDIGIYGSRLWMVINCSNKVEVCDAATTRRLGQVNISNCRYLAFDGGYAYVSSYAGPVQVSENCALGRVYKVDTLTLQAIDSVTVGYQPEEMAILDHHLYVANSGGYRVPRYDDRISVIDLTTFRMTGELTVGINLHRMQADAHGQLWVSSRGNYADVAPSLWWIRPDTGQTGQLSVPVSAMTLVGDSLYYIGTSYSMTTGGYTKDFGIIDVTTHQPLTTSLFDDAHVTAMTLPYGIIVNPYARDFYLMDAKNYVSSGELLHFLPDGSFDYKVWTGDIPSRGAFRL